MLRLLLLIVVVALVVAALRGWLHRARPRHGERAGAAVKMRCCAHCGVYVPEHEAVHAGGLSYCSEAHRRAARPDP